MEKSAFRFLSLILFSCLLISCDDGDGGGGGSTAKSPEFKILYAPPIVLGNQDNYKVAGTCTDAGRAITINVGPLPAEDVQCSDSLQWQAFINVSAINVGDAITIIVSESGVPLDKEVVRDTTRPRVSIAGNQAIVSIINQGNYRLSGTCDEEDGEVVLDVGGITKRILCDGSNWRADEIDLGALQLADDVTSIDGHGRSCRLFGQCCRASAGNASQGCGSSASGFNRPWCDQ